MAGVTEAFTLTPSAYQDVSEGASEVWFEVPFNRNTAQDVRMVLAASLPSAGTNDYVLISHANPIGPDNKPESIPVSLSGLDARVYLRTDTAASLVIRVMRM